MSKIPHPAQAARAAEAAHVAARDELKAAGSAHTQEQLQSATDAATVAAKARAAEAHFNRTPAERAKGAALAASVPGLVSRWFVAGAPPGGKGRMHGIVLSEGQFQEWNEGRPVSGLPEGVELSHEPA